AEIVAIQAFVDIECAAQQTGAAGFYIDTFYRLQRTYAHACAITDDNIDAVINAIDEINVSVSRRTEQRGRACRESFAGMRGRVVRPEVSLYLYNAPNALDTIGNANKMFAPQALRDIDDIALIKIAG